MDDFLDGGFSEEADGGLSEEADGGLSEVRDCLLFSN